MAVPSYAPTLADLALRMDPNGSVASIIELLNQTNPILDDMPWVEGNLPTGHKTTIRSGLPTGTWRKLNYGVQPEKSTTVQVVDTCGMLESYAEVDKDLVKLNGNSAAFRLSEDRAFIEGMNQTMAETLFYGDSSLEPEKFTGLSARYNDITNPENKINILDASGTSNLTSVWLVVWGANTVHGIYPKGSSAGLSSQDLGEVTLDDDAGGHYQGYRTHYKWDTGLTVRDWRYVVRIANIDVTALTKNPGALTASGGALSTVGGADLIDLMTQALEIVPSMSMGTPVFYANRTISSFLRRQMVNKVVGSTLAMSEVSGRRVMTFDEVPFRRTDGIINNETQVQ